MPDPPDTIEWSSRSKLFTKLRVLIQTRLSQLGDVHARADGPTQRALCLLASIANDEELTAVPTWLPETAMGDYGKDLLANARASRASALELRQMLAASARAIERDLEHASHPHWNSVAANTAVRLLIRLPPTAREQVIASELGERAPRFLGHLFMAAQRVDGALEQLGPLLLETWRTRSRSDGDGPLPHPLVLACIRHLPSTDLDDLRGRVDWAAIEAAPPQTVQLSDLAVLDPQHPMRAETMARALRLQLSDLLVVLEDAGLAARIEAGIREVDHARNEDLLIAFAGARESGAPLWVRIAARIKGGYRVTTILTTGVGRPVVAFLPASQIGGRARESIESGQIFVGRVFRLRARRSLVVTLDPAAELEAEPSAEFIAQLAEDPGLRPRAKAHRELDLLGSWPGGAELLARLLADESLGPKTHAELRLAWCRHDHARATAWLIEQPPSEVLDRLGLALLHREVATPSLIRWAIARTNPALVSAALRRAGETLSGRPNECEMVAALIEGALDERDAEPDRQQLWVVAGSWLTRWADPRGLEILLALGRRGERRVRPAALEQLVELAPDAAAELFHTLVADAPEPSPRTHDHIVLRLALHGLAAGHDKRGHDRLLATVLERSDGPSFLPTVARLVGIAAIDPDPFWDPPR